jgi:hypothetical protein
VNLLNVCCFFLLYIFLNRILKALGIFWAWISIFSNKSPEIKMIAIVSIVSAALPIDWLFSFNFHSRLYTLPIDRLAVGKWFNNQFNNAYIHTRKKRFSSSWWLLFRNFLRVSIIMSNRNKLMMCSSSWKRK